MILMNIATSLQPGADGRSALRLPQVVASFPISASNQKTSTRRPQFGTRCHRVYLGGRRSKDRKGRIHAPVASRSHDATTRGKSQERHGPRPLWKSDSFRGSLLPAGLAGCIGRGGFSHFATPYAPFPGPNRVTAADFRRHRKVTRIGLKTAVIREVPEARCRFRGQMADFNDRTITGLINFRSGNIDAV